MADDKQAEQAAREIRDIWMPGQLSPDTENYVVACIAEIISKHYASKLEAAKQMAEALKELSQDDSMTNGATLIERWQRANAAKKAWESTL